MQATTHTAQQPQRTHSGINALRLPKVIDKTGLSRTHIYRLVQLGKFPKPSLLTERVSAWNEADIDTWLAEKFAA
jgi:prophage regulatory protein